MVGHRRLSIPFAQNCMIWNNLGGDLWGILSTHLVTEHEFRIRIEKSLEMDFEYNSALN